MLKYLLYRLYERRLLGEVARGPIPRHLGLIQDGHRRYAREAGLSNLKGYRLGATKAEEVLTWCAQLRIPMVTLWWLSTENLRRDAVDVSAVLEVIEDKIPEWVQGGLERRDSACEFAPSASSISCLSRCSGRCSSRRQRPLTTSAYS